MSVRSRRRRRGGSARPVACAPVSTLADLPVGPGLAAALAQLALPALTGHELVLALRARYRQANHERAMLIATVAEVMRRSDPQFGMADDALPAGGSSYPVDEPGSAEVRAALTLSRRGGNDLCAFAADLVVRLPQVLQAWLAGVLDQARARIFHLWTTLLSDAHTRAIVSALLPRAPQLTTAQLVEAIRRAAIELDPEWARRRYEKALRGRRVEGSIALDGTGTLAGYELPADAVAAACDRLDAIARQAKSHGHPGKIDTIRADIYLGLLDGSYTGLDDTQLLAELLARIPTTPDTGPEASNSDGEPGAREGNPTSGAHPSSDRAHPSSGGVYPSSGGPADSDRRAGGIDEPGSRGDQPGGTEPDTRAPHPVDDHPAADDPAPSEPTPTESEPAQSGPAESKPRLAQPAPSRQDAQRQGVLRQGAQAGGGESTVDGRAGAAAGAAAGGVRRVRGRGLRLLTGLGTIAGVDRRTSTLLGWGSLHAELARRITAAPHASWWYVLIEPDGTPIDVGHLRRRPTTAWTDGPTPGYRDVEVWLQVTRSELTTLLDTPPPGWAPVLADIANRIATHPPGPPNGNPTDRLPNAALRRWIHIRDQHCTFPGCRVPAHHGDIDHTHQHAAGGPTLDHNLAPTCRADHTLKHQNGWHAQHLTPGHIRWTSPLGHSYHRTPPDGPDQALHPIPGLNPPDPDHDTPALPIQENWQTNTCLWIIPPPPPPQPKPEPQPTPTPSNDEPPF